ncbi:MAG: hypothetical protein RL329_1268, partial [Bacteroidota bacterium]
MFINFMKLFSLILSIIGLSQLSIDA